MTDTVLVTGAFGLVGSATVHRLAADGRRVVATDLDTPGNQKAAAALPVGVTVRWADLTDPSAVGALVADIAPSAIIHLAAVIPPFIYQRRGLAEKVNVGATASLVAAAEKLPTPARFVLASSIAVYGSRNPHTVSGVLTADTPVNPADIYGDHKVKAEALVRSSALDWVILRLGGVLTVNPGSYMKMDNFYFEGMLPTDGRLQTVDVRDVARAFAAATTADAVGETLLIGGDDNTHRLPQGDVAPAMAAALGLVGGLPTGLKGDPHDDAGWFNTDWMDTTRSQEVLDFQRHSWPQMLIETAENAGIKRPLLRLVAPLAKQVLQRRTAYYGTGQRYADPWQAIKAKWGDPRPDGSQA
ncbi:NAD(P)-dependent oxidoreductase [Mycolicibacterium fluoranthenivorans]|jgi:nucleoside-diphosphate-sugar epimerase|uniref:NAD(P)-dependent oxidoreductase n=1 Tax=Mycolicibacterium fluoranthenivorans TaxID=258505 RepID=A0A7G8PCY9_9MYCO|nr:MULTISPECIES: NAD(P)-dependent oxidoreductase [Mycobacteriaceae]MCV7255587.1 NAD(P)-dependent oxidoreductase [Mycobacterium hackensackense]QNJ92205.1 NAD(P)-dependent oxidoreductase [Mycolicibacterium fluoranthenivorans]